MSKATLDAIFNAERELRSRERQLLESAHDQVVDALKNAVAEARELRDRNEGEMRLERLADLCAQVEGPEMVEALLAILDDDAPSVRVHAAEALVDVAFERYAEVARATERAVASRLSAERAGSALRELPWVVLEVGEPSARKLITSFLELRDAGAVASAVEALAALGDTEALDDLRLLADDPRQVEPEDEEEASHSLGELVCEAIEALESIG